MADVFHIKADLAPAEEIDAVLDDAFDVNTATLSGIEEIDASLGEVYEVNVAVRDYEVLINHPRIEGNELIGDKTFVQLGLAEITPSDIDNMMLDDLIENLGGNGNG